MYGITDNVVSFRQSITRNSHHAMRLRTHPQLYPTIKDFTFSWNSSAVMRREPPRHEETVTRGSSMATVHRAYQVNTQNTGNNALIAAFLGHDRRRNSGKVLSPLFSFTSLVSRDFLDKSRQDRLGSAKTVIDTPDRMLNCTSGSTCSDRVNQASSIVFAQIDLVTFTS